MRQRRIIAVFLALALFLGMMPPAMAATSRCDYIGHSWGSWTTVKQPTCTQGGTQERTCTRCGKKESKSIAAKGHSFKYLKTEQEATCTGDGIAVFTCPQCSAKENRTIKATGHEWDEGVVTQPEGLLEPGVKTYTCKKCGETRTEEISTVSTYSGKSIMDKLRNIPEGPGEAGDGTGSPGGHGSSGPASAETRRKGQGGGRMKTTRKVFSAFTPVSALV